VIHDDANLYDYTDDQGRIQNSEILKNVVQNMGYDGIIDRTVNKKFGSERRVGKGMEGMDPDTVHYIAFEPNQIKSAIGNTGEFDPSNPDIRFMPDDEMESRAKDDTFNKAEQSPDGRTRVAFPSGRTLTGEQDKELNFMPLLSIGSDPKTIKGQKQGIMTGIMYLAPANAASKKITMCPFATEECKAACLYTAGMAGVLHSINEARIGRTTFWQTDPKGFLDQVEQEINKLIKKAEKAGMTPVVRLNGTSDVKWEDTGIMEKFPDIQFYDYTKYPPNLRKNLPPNYHLTYSYTGLPISEKWSKQWADRGVNSAVVFRGGLPKKFMGRPVIDGDETDLRFMDPKGVIVGLKAKGKARTGVSSFVQDVNESMMADSEPQKGTGKKRDLPSREQ
jgi:hypothetical protein